ncbi:hypothetical protein [Thalassomonas sp. RHCl1]|uniref:hypothetical protein n=1 Tax=Thalassomonas sp. RHCl1 TaxID=2995320 RepID=UPI00248BF785|nr:hypothetical protein [Thalassomonas sp. RHCl1]
MMWYITAIATGSISGLVKDLFARLYISEKQKSNRALLPAIKLRSLVNFYANKTPAATPDGEVLIPENYSIKDELMMATDLNQSGESQY